MGDPNGLSAARASGNGTHSGAASVARVVSHGDWFPKGAKGAKGLAALVSRGGVAVGGFTGVFPRSIGLFCIGTMVANAGSSRALYWWAGP